MEGRGRTGGRGGKGGGEGEEGREEGRFPVKREDRVRNRRIENVEGE